MVRLKNKIGLISSAKNRVKPCWNKPVLLWRVQLRVEVWHLRYSLVWPTVGMTSTCITVTNWMMETWHIQFWKEFRWNFLHHHLPHFHWDPL